MSEELEEILVRMNRFLAEEEEKAHPKITVEWDIAVGVPLTTAPGGTVRPAQLGEVVYGYVESVDENGIVRVDMGASFANAPLHESCKNQATPTQPKTAIGTIAPDGSGKLVIYGGQGEAIACDGRELTIAGNIGLFKAIGKKYGGGGGTFRVPDLRSRAK